MKYSLKLSVFIICFSISHVTQGQTIVGKVYVTFSDQISVFGVNRSGNLDSSLKYSVKNGTKFSVCGFDENNNVLITFWRYSQWDPAKKKNVYTRSDTITKTYWNHYSDSLEFVGKWANFKKFAISPKLLNSSCREYFGIKKEFTWGVLTLPIKARLGNHENKFFDFEERLNLGFVFGLKKQLKGYLPHSLNYLFGFGIVSARTDSISLKNVSLYDGKNSLGLSLHTGALYQFDNFQIGLFFGTDYIPGKLGRVWRYQGQPWIGLALGVSLFSKNVAEGDKKGETQ